MFNNLKKWFKQLKQSIEDAKRDPVKECKLYKDQGCVFVDGPFCDFPHCSMNKKYQQPSVTVYSHNDFDRFCGSIGVDDTNVEENTDYAFISIIGTKQVLEDYLDEGYTCHYFHRNHPNVLNLEFDDVHQDFEFHGIQFKGISEEQARQCVNFIDANRGKKFIIHCRAGVSRSAAIGEFIQSGFYEEYAHSYHPQRTPNAAVLSALKRAWYEKNNIFVE